MWPLKNSVDFRSFLKNKTPVWVLGSLSGELGIELKAFKRGSLPYPHKILDAFSQACKGISCDALVYIPSNRYDVMGFFAKECASILGVPLWEGLRYARPAQEQKFLATRRKRRENVRTAFELVSLPGPTCPLLIDDVYASGETLDVVLTLLQEHGIHPVGAIVFALREDFLE